MMMSDVAIPTRYSVFDEDFDWDLGHRLIISLDGVEQEQVVAYDIEAGTVTRNKLNEAGEVYVDPVLEEVAKETVHGTVTVTLKPEEPECPKQP